MSVDRREVERIAELARLGFEPHELERLTDELNRILEHVEALRALVGAPSDERAVVDAALSSTRPSEPAEPDVLGAGPGAFAPLWAEGFFLVPPPPGVHDQDMGP